MLFVSVICRFILFEKKNRLTSKSYVITRSHCECYFLEINVTCCIYL